MDHMPREYAQETSICHLKGGNVIGRVFGVSRKTLVGWAKDGAPLAIVGKKYQANYQMLLRWLIERGETAGQSRVRREGKKNVQ